MKSLDYHNLLARDWPQDVIIEGGILSKGDRLLLGGEPKSGKSILLAQMVRGLVLGTDFLGFNIRRPRRVLYVQAELREGRLKDRLMPWEMWAQQHDIHIPEGMFYIWSTNGPLHLTEAFGDDEAKNPNHPLNQIYDEMNAIKPEVIIFDPMASFHDMVENDAKQMKQLTIVVDRIKEHMDVGIVIAHHFRKGSLSDIQVNTGLYDKIRGSSVMAAWADSIIAIYGNQTTRDVKHLEFLLRDSDELPERVITYNYETKAFDAEDPLQHARGWVEKYFEEKDGVSTSKFVTDLRIGCPQASKSNQNGAQALKDVLLRSGVLAETRDGNKKVLRLASKMPNPVKESMNDVSV